MLRQTKTLTVDFWDDLMINLSEKSPQSQSFTLLIEKVIFQKEKFKLFKNEAKSISG